MRAEFNKQSRLLLFFKGLTLVIEKYFLANKKQALIEFQL
jgi:hypothetical protein